MGFSAPWFLAGLAAVSVPVFVHLLRRHVTTPRPVSSLMFFERGTQSSTRHRRLRHLLLFALRLLLVLLVVLAFAEPFLHRKAADVNGHLALIVVDTSFSMRAGTRLSDARQQALTWLAEKPRQQRAQVFALGQHLELLTQPTADSAQLRSALQAIAPGDSHSTFGELGRAVRSLAQSARQPVDLHFFSDLQRTAMPSNFADLQLPENVTLTLHPVAQGAALANWTLESVEAPTDLSDPKDPTHSRVKAVVAGFNTPAATRTVALIINGKTVSTHRVDVPSNGRASVEFAPLDVSYGFNRCELRLVENDAFNADNASLFTVRRADPERVLFLHGAGDQRSDFYFNAALNAAAPNRFVLQPVLTEQAADLAPVRFSFVVLADTGTLPSVFAHALSQYVTKGGSVLITLGPRSSRLPQTPLGDLRITGSRAYVQHGAPATAGQMDFTHPALAQSAASADNGGWSTVKFFYAVHVDPAQARVAARLADGTPLLIDEPVGEGHIIVLTSGLDNITSDLPLHPVFVPLVDHLSQYLAGHENLSGARVVDAFVPLRAPGEPTGQLGSVEVVDPDGHRPLSLGEARTAQSLQLRRAGFYQIRLANGREAVLGVNPDRRESDLAPMPPEVQQLWTANGSSTPSRSDVVATSEVNTRVPLWWYVILIALLAGAAETLFASGYLGTQREEA